jgi:asparagine synthase (glutamine-hydrolysing)
VFAAIFDSAGFAIDISRFEVPSNALVSVAGNAALLHVAGGSPATAETFLEFSPTRPLQLVGRIRLDGRTDLRTALAAPPGLSDGDLVGLAYERWGESFLEHLAGDFCFVLVDKARRQLIAARDQLGVRALHYTNLGSLWLVSDSLDWLARQRAADCELDDYWIADFLTIGFCREFERTVWRNIHRLPPAHRLRLRRAGMAIQCYWRLEIGEPLYLKRRQEYGEQFRSVVRTAIADRLPDGPVGIAMSGGLDSTTLAALTVEQTGNPGRVVAECNHFNQLMHIDEDDFASLAARHIGIQLTVRDFDNRVYDRHWRERGIRAPEPTKMLLDAHHLRTVGLEQAGRATVWFEGEGPDNALPLERRPYLAWLRRRRSWLRLGEAWLQYALVKGGSGWRQTLRRYLLPQTPVVERPLLPHWINRDFVEELKVTQRIESLGAGGDATHPWHPEAFASFTSPIWQNYLGDFDFQDSLAPTQHRVPYLDLRVLAFMLRVPPVPWGWKKQLLREAMRERLPRKVLTREKTPLALYPDVAVARREGLAPLAVPDRLQRYVDVALLPGLEAPETLIAGVFAVHALDHWLADTASLRPPANSEILAV